MAGGWQHLLEMCGHRYAVNTTLPVSDFSLPMLSSLGMSGGEGRLDQGFAWRTQQRERGD